MNQSFSKYSPTQDIPVFSRCSACGRDVRGTVKPSLERKNTMVVSFVCCVGEDAQVEDDVLWRSIRVTERGPCILFTAFGTDRPLMIDT